MVRGTHQLAVTATIVGPRTADRLTRSLRAPEITLTEETLRGLEEIWNRPGGEAPEAYAW
jgi:aryl-alcohol dehydrogenase-like predicted oxidoreductase